MEEVGQFLRLIASVQILGIDRAVKTVSFKPEYYLGDPVNIIRILNDKGAQEIAVIDLEASANGVIKLEQLRALSEETSVPFLYGGGIGIDTDIRKLANIGVERFLTSRFLEKDLAVTQKLTKVLGSSSVSLSIDIEEMFQSDSGLLLLLRRYGNRYISTNELLHSLIQANVGEVVFRPTWLDGTDGSESFTNYSQLLDDPNIKELSCRVRTLLGTGIRNTSILESLAAQFEIDGAVVGAMVSLTKSNGILTSYPSAYSVK
jgi:imidazole glycerol phosphate synthase subunit HisF